jgi:glycosyltransferase involved in cell wall biosynthesis
MNINFACPINHTGYGIASMNILKELHKQHHNISYFPIGEPSIDNQQDYDLIYQLFSNQNQLDINAPYIKIWHQFDLATKVGRGKYYAYPFFELDTFNQREKLHLSIPDEIIVSSNWAKNIIANNGITSKVNVVPLGVDTKTFNYKLQKNTDSDKYIFLTIGKWEIRKGHDLLPKIFKAAFPNKENVELWILAAEHTSSYTKPDEIETWKNYYSADNIKVIPGVQSHKEVAQIIANSDCGLYISRAEGWNLELLETMAMNKPAIATNYSAHTEFCNSNNCYLVDINETEPAYDGKAFIRQGNWAKIGQQQIDQIIHYMRYVYKNNKKENIAGLNTALELSWKNSAEILNRCIDQ